MMDDIVNAQNNMGVEQIFLFIMPPNYNKFYNFTIIKNKTIWWFQSIKNNWNSLLKQKMNK
jgi:hypothetical protein